MAWIEDYIIQTDESTKGGIMINAWDIYLISQLDNFIFLFAIVGVFGFILSCISIIIYWGNIDNDPESKQLKTIGKVGKIFIIPMALCVIIAVALPSTKTAVAMWGVPKIVNNEEISELPHNAAKLINKKLKSWMEDNLGGKP